MGSKQQQAGWPTTASAQDTESSRAARLLRVDDRSLARAQLQPGPTADEHAAHLQRLPEALRDVGARRLP